MLLFSSSQNRDLTLYPSGNSYTLYLSSPVKNIERVDLVSARVPNTMYNLTNGADVITIAGKKYSLNPGFYGVYDLATALAAAQTAVAVTYLTFEGKFLFSSGVSFSVKVNSTELANLLGVPAASALGATQVSAGSTWPAYVDKYILTSNVVVNTSVGEQIFLDIDELKTPDHMFTGGLQSAPYSNGYTIQTTSGSGPSRAFAPITLDVKSGCIKHFNENSDYKISVFYPEPINSLQRLTVRWLDVNGQPLVFNGLEQNSFILRLHVKAPVTDPTVDVGRLPPPVPIDSGPNMILVSALMFVGLLFILFVKNSRNE